MNFVKYSIQGIAKTKMDKIEAKMKEFVAARRNNLHSEKRKTADNSVRFADV